MVSRGIARSSGNVTEVYGIRQTYREARIDPTAAIAYMPIDYVTTQADDKKTNT